MSDVRGTGPGTTTTRATGRTTDRATADTVAEPASTTDKSAAQTRMYRLTKGSHGKYDETGEFRRYKAGSEGGDLIPLTAREAEVLGSRVELVGGTGGGEAPVGQYSEAVATTRVAADTDPGEEQKTGAPTSQGTAPAQLARQEAVKLVQGEESAFEEGEEEGEGEGETDDGTYGLSDLSWSDAKDVIMSLETAEEVEAARAEEENGKGRKSVLDAVETRLGQLEE